MQDFHSIPGLADRLFGVSGGVPDHRRHRGYPGTTAGQDPPAKCPRCDSTNTKFCYYNNYNLSQPRHFCKSCRRYWTKGGVLRNVPVGGGCRKSSSSKRASNSSNNKLPKKKSIAVTSQSSSDTSSLTLATDKESLPSVPSDHVAAAAEAAALTPTTEFIPEMFQETGTFTSMMMNGQGCLGLGFTEQIHPMQMPQEDVRIPAPLIDELPAMPRMEWPTMMDQTLFDIPGGVDGGGYWSHGQWGDTDAVNLYMP